MSDMASQSPDQAPAGEIDLAEALARLRRVGSPMIDAALAYARLGIPVFPCCPNLKRPLTPGESSLGAKDGGLYLATTKEQELRSWWKRWPLAMIGVPMGQTSGLVAFDIDVGKVRPPDDEIEALLAQGVEQLRNAAGELPASLMTRTPRGGAHLLYASPPGIELGNRANLFRAKAYPQIDFRGQGGYVIFAPSQRRGRKAKDEGCESQLYEWSATEGPDETFAARQMTPSMVELLTRKSAQPAATVATEVATPKARASATSKDDSSGIKSDRRKRAYAQKALKEEIAGLNATASGSRNDRLNIVAMKLGQLVPHGLLSKTEIKSELEAACHANGLVKEDGLTSVRATIYSGLQKGISEPRDLSFIERDVAEQIASGPGHRDGGTSRAPVGGDAAAARCSIPFPLPKYGKLEFIWRKIDDAIWLCTAEQKKLRDKATGEDLIFTVYEKVSSPFQIEAWLRRVTPQGEGSGLRIEVTDAATGLINVVDIERRHAAGSSATNIVLPLLYEAGLQIEQEKIVANIVRSMRPEKEVVILPCTGWHELPSGPVFALPDGKVLGDGDTAIELDGNVAIPSADALSGSLGGWKKAVKAVFNDDRVPHFQLGLIAGFAGPILTLAGFDSCGLVWTGSTSRGKSTAQELAVSVWSTPEIRKQGLMKSALTTANAIEALLANANGTHLALDELATADGKTVGKAIFGIASGRGKERLAPDSTMRKTRTWNTFVTLSSEKSLETFVGDDGGLFTDGAALRILGIDISSVDDSDKAELFEQIHLIEQNYGHAGPAFIKTIIAKGLHAKGDELRRRILDVAQSLANGDPGAHEEANPPGSALIRAARPLAIVQIAGEMAQKFGLLPKTVDCAKVVEWAWDRFKESADRLVKSPKERAIEALSLFIARKWDVSIREIDSSKPANREAEAWYDAEAIYIPTDLLSQAANNIMQQKPLAKVLKDEALLVRTEGDHSTVRLRTGKNQLRVYALKRDVFAGTLKAKTLTQDHLPYKD